MKKFAIASILLSSVLLSGCSSSSSPVQNQVPAERPNTPLEEGGKSNDRAQEEAPLE